MIDKEMKDKICDRYYYVEYCRADICGVIKGLLLNYNYGTIDILSKNGIYHINYEDILFMMPIKKEVRSHEDDC